jgi:DHA1 family tetracycline resistance protein-like MFS transporter
VSREDRQHAPDVLHADLRLLHQVVGRQHNGLAGAASQGLMTRRVGVSEQGQLQGANGSVRSITELLGPRLFTQSFAFFVAAGAPLRLPGAPFLLASLLLAAALLMAWQVTRPR